ncbi:hypothetical protein K502DRAFT_324511 [Neoconidiobolus thromboides FSU 785]|nr:hypothetical protein K502DRAFT_324511 [Neoconidiobolus thromboides FSU 785]
MSCTLCDKKMDYFHDWMLHFQSNQHLVRLKKEREKQREFRPIYGDRELVFLNKFKDFSFRGI